MVEPRVSVVIPAFNAAATIRTAIASVEAQTLQPSEIIVVDDGSTDQTAQVVAEAFPAIKLMRQHNQGCGAARNTGVRASSGDWLAFLDADDTWRPYKLERQVPATGDPRVAVVASPRATKDGTPTPERIGFDDLWPRNDVIVSSTLVRRSAFEAAGGFWARRACEDYHLWLRLTAEGWEIANCAEGLVVYAPTAASLSRQVENFATAELACVQDIASRFAMPERRLHERLASCYLKHARAAVNTRHMSVARRFLVESLRYRRSVGQLAMLAVACVPPAMLDLRRRVVGEG